MRKLKNNELGRIDVKEFKQIPKTPLIIILDDIRSLNNIGSIFRTADAFIIEKIILCGITASPPNKDIQKTALGSTESVDWEYQKDISLVIKNLKKEGVYIWSIEQTENSNKLNDLEIEKNRKHAIILGNEVKGVSQNAVDLSDNVIEIPQFGTKHSLNVSACSAILIWEFYNSLS
jgi:tRNA G18 (ribose-2'-O)-methylase SpoU